MSTRTKPWYTDPHTPERYALEEEALDRACELLHSEDGRIRNALYELEREVRDELDPDHGPSEYDRCRDYTREIVRHVEQCWATAVLR